MKSMENYFHVGDLFYHGIFGADKNLLDAAKFYQAADLENNAQATFNLGLMHLFGIGLDRVRKVPLFVCIYKYNGFSRICIWPNGSLIKH